MKASLEFDLQKIEWISYKCRTSSKYAQNLYAALCNNRFFKDTDEWTCSWRYAGGIVSSLIGEGEYTDLYSHRRGDYMDWYCSGVAAGNNGYVEEGTVTSEVSNDLLNLGWRYEQYSPRLEPGIYTNRW